MKTSKGDLEFELWPDKAPKTVANFKYLASNRFYDGTAFHRVISNLVIQGGDPFTRNDVTKANETNYGTGGPGYTVADEFGSPGNSDGRGHVRGVISMAHSAAANSGGSQFFVMFNSASEFDGNYASFGKVTPGTANEGVLNALEGVETVNLDGTSQKPVSRVEVSSVRIRVAVSGADKAAFKAASYSGFLRGVNRGAMGMYTISVTAKGAFSGSFQYFGRTSKVAGTLALSADKTEANASLKLDAAAGVPLKCDLNLRLASTSGSGVNVLTVVVSDANLLASDRNATMAVSCVESISADRLSDRFNLLVYPPVDSSGKAVSEELQGYGSLNASFTRTSGMMALAGRLADGMAFSATRYPVNESGRYVVPLFDLKLRADVEGDGALYSDVPLSKWPYKVNRCNIFQVSGAVELPQSGSSGALSGVNWRRAEKISGPASGEFSGFSSVLACPLVVSGSANLEGLAWMYPTAPISSKTTIPAPFNPAQPKGRLLIEGLGEAEFTLSSSGTTATFAPLGISSGTASASQKPPTLTFDLKTGSFSGSFYESDSPTVKRSFTGALMPYRVLWDEQLNIFIPKVFTSNSVLVSAGAGYALNATTSLKVQILPIISTSASPVIENVPPSITVPAESEEGAVVDYLKGMSKQPTARSTSVRVVYLAADHDNLSKFPVGTTTVTITAKDLVGYFTGSSVKSTFQVTVSPYVPAAQPSE